MSGNWCQLSTFVEAEYQQIQINIGMGRASQKKVIETGEVIRPGENLDAQHSHVLTKFKTSTEHRVNIGQTDQVRWYSTSTRVRSAAEFLGETTVQTKRCALNRPQKIDRLASMMSIFTIEPGEIIPSGTTLNDILKVDREEGRTFRGGRDVKHMENETEHERKLAAESYFPSTRVITKDKRTKGNKTEGVTKISMRPLKGSVLEIPSSVDGQMTSMDATQTVTSPKISGQLEGLNVKTGEKKAMSINTSKGNEEVNFPLKVYQNSEFKDMSLENIKFIATDDNNNGSERLTVGGADLDSSNTSRENDDLIHKDIDKDIREEICATTTIPAEQEASHTSSAKSNELMNTAEKPGKQAIAAVQTWDEVGQNEANTLRKKTDDSKDKSPTLNGVTCERKNNLQIQESSKLIGQKLKGILKYANTPKTEPTKPLECPSSVGKELRRILKPTRMNRFDLMEKPGFIDRYFLTWEKLAIIKALKAQQVNRKTQQSYCGTEVINEKEADPKKTGNTHEDSSDSDNALAEDQTRDKEKGQPCKLNLPPHSLKSCHGPQKRLMTKANNFDDGDSDSDCAIAEDLSQDQGDNDHMLQSVKRLPGKLKDERDAISSSDNDSFSDCAKAEDLPIEHKAWSRKQIKHLVNQKDAADSKRSKRHVAGKALLHIGTDDSTSTRTETVHQGTSNQSPDSDDDTFSENAQNISWSGSDSDCNLVEDLPFDNEDHTLTRKEVKQHVAGKATLHIGTDDSNSTRTETVHRGTSKQSPDSDDDTFSANAQTISSSGSDSDCNLVEDLPFDNDISREIEQLETSVKAKRDTRPNERDIHLDGRHTDPNERNSRPNERYSRRNKRDTQLDERHTQASKGCARPNERDTRPNKMDTQLDGRPTHPNKRTTCRNERDTPRKEKDTHPNERDPQLNERDTRQKERDTRQKERDTRRKERDTRQKVLHRCPNEGDNCHSGRATRPADRHTRHCDTKMTILERISLKSKRRTNDTDPRSTVDTPARTGLYSRKVSQNLDRLFGRDELCEYLEPPINPYHGLTVVDLRSKNPVDVYNQRCHRNSKNIYSTMYPPQNNGTGHRTQREAQPEVKRTIGLNLSRSHNTPSQGRLSRIMRSFRGKIKNLKETFCGCLT